MTLLNTTTGHQLSSIIKGETYTLVLEGFDEKSMVTLLLVLESGAGLPLGLIPSFQGPSQSWQWTVGTLLPAEQYVAVKAYQPDRPRGKVAFVPQVMVHATGFESSFESLLESLSELEQQNVHPTLPASYDRLRHLLATVPTKLTRGRR